jgi:hypothetical protein
MNASATRTQHARDRSDDDAPAAPAPASPWPLVELRRYTLQPGRRDELVDLFEREFLDPQEAAGMQVLLHAREPAAPDRFVWFRGFRDLPSRAPALAAFYDGPVWRAHRDAANATMVDSDDVHLLREAMPGSGFAAPPARPPLGATPSGAIVDVSIHHLATPVDRAFIAFFADEVAPVARACGARILASYMTDAGPNEFPRLPVHEGEHVFVWVAACDDAPAHARARAAFERSSRWREVMVELARRTIEPTERHRLAPAARSLVRGLLL